MDARTMFRKEYNGATNFMTPRVISRRKAGDLAYEISRGEAILSDGSIYGVTVLRENTDGTITREHGLSMVFYSLAEAEEYAASL